MVWSGGGDFFGTSKNVVQSDMFMRRGKEKTEGDNDDKEDEKKRCNMEKREVKR